MREQYCKQVSFKSTTILNFDGHITWCLPAAERATPFFVKEVQGLITTF